MSLKQLKILFPNINEGVLHYTKCSCCGCAPRPITSLVIYIQHETYCKCQQPRPSFAWILPICNIIFPIIDQCRYFFLPLWWQSPDPQMSFLFEQQKYQNLTQRQEYVAKLLFLQVDEGFWLYWCLIQVYINYIRLCFSILLL